MIRIKYWVPVIIWMAVIYYFSTRQRVQVSEEFFLNFLFFKTLHVIEYFVLYGLIYRAVVQEFTPKAHSPVFLYSLFITLLYAITDEVHQAFVPSREPALRDVIIDGTGAILSWICIRILLPKAPQKLRHLANKLDMPA